MSETVVSRRALLRLVALSGGIAWLTRNVSAETAPEPSAPRSVNDRMTGDFFPVHDPCMIKAGDIYHLFCTGHVHDPTGLIPWRTSKDLVHWTLRGRVFDSLPSWAQVAVPGTNGLWAPDIAWFNGKYHLYYSVSTFGSNRSVIGLATNATLDPDSPEFAWRDQGPILESRRDDDFNAIDPNHVQGRDGRHWLCLGSFWSGIKLFEMDAATGKPKANEPYISLASRPAPQDAPGAIEAPFLIERDGYYYLFVSYDYCCRGTSSSYYTVVGRSKQVTGPYVGRDGKPMMQGYGTLLLRGDRRYRGPGHPAVLRDANADYLIYHAYDAQHDGRPTLRISPIEWTHDRWPKVQL